MIRTPRRLLTVATMMATSLAPAMAMAHPGHAAGHDFMAGVMHPLSGLDHLLMIVAVSIWAGGMAPRVRMLVASCLALFVAVGAMLPFAPAAGPGLEAAIAFTVLGAGVLLATNRRSPAWVSALLATVFALIHGFAHGAEGPAGVAAYVPGLALATGALAIGVSWLAARMQSHRAWLQVAGVASAVTGIALLA